MSDPVKPEAESRKHTVIWRAEDWDRIEQAARAIQDREHVEVSPVDLIRGATLRRVEEILAGEAAA